jgi:small subunit ribosomal protein S4e
MKRGTKSVKRLNVSKSATVKHKKRDTWVVRTDPGSHLKNDALPLALLIRDVLGYAQTLKEVKKILGQGKVLVDGRIVKNYRFPIGLMDIVSFPDQNKCFRIILNNKGKLIPVEINEPNEFTKKIVQIKRKFVQKKGRVTLMFHDGRNLIIKEKGYAPGDSLIISVPKVTIEKHVPLKQGSMCYVVKGKHIGQVASVVEFKDIGMGRKQVMMEKDDETRFYTIRKYLFPIDDKKWVNYNEVAK